jgi:2-methylcitrate dehydratase PrpD
MTLSEEIASIAHTIVFSKIPPHTVERARLFFIDTFGVALAGRGVKGNKEVAELVTAWGGKKEATILYSGERVPAQLAALVNSLMVHSTEYDDIHEAGGAHINVSVIPSALAVSQRKGGVSGKELLTAIILGVDLVCRLGASLSLYPGWHISSTYGVFGAALAAGKILSLTPEALTNALGMAYSQAAGTRQGRLEGTLTKRLQPALACQSGVMAALIAEKGLTGPKEWIEGTWGMARVYSDSHEQIQEDSIRKLKRGVGEVFLGDDLSFKLYPCCKVTHTSIEATLALVEENHINLDEMDEVIVNVSPGAYKTVGSPFKIRTNPQVDAQFSIPYTVALALVRKKVNLDGFDEETIRDPRITATAKRVRVMIDPEMEDVSSNMVNLASKVAIHSKRGVFSKDLAICKGHPDRPIDKEDIFRKFHECCQYNKTLSDKEIENTLSLLRELEDVKDVNEIFGQIKWSV